jgi:hypothetical protein
MLPAAAGMLASWPQLALGALVGAAGTVAVMSVLSAVASPPAPASSTSAAPVSVSAPRPAAEPALLPAPTPTPANTQADASSDAPPTGSVRRSSPSSAPVASESPVPTPAADGLQQEIQLLEAARRQLSSDPGQAQRVLLEHERRFAGGQLRIEREFLLIDALVRLGRRGEAEARARVLEGQAPTSLYGERLDQILGRSGAGKKARD